MNLKSTNRSRKAWTMFFLTRIGGMLVDTCVMAFVYLVSFALRFDFYEPSWGWMNVALSFVTVWVVQIFSFLVTGCYSLVWRRINARDLPKYLGAILISGGVLTLLRYFMPSASYAYIRPPYSITLINMSFLAMGTLGVRYLWRYYMGSRTSPNSLLLNRTERQTDTTQIVSLLRGKCVLVTGAGGTIGSELVQQAAFNGARQIILVERGENALYEIDRSIRQLSAGVDVVSEMVDIADEPRMRKILEKFKPEIILHAAAYKHVPMVEVNPREGLRNNTIATRKLGEWACEAGVERFVMISTDKAVNPIGVMGISKRIAEILLMDLNGKGMTLFSAVRFGNVLGSSGSVVPLFKEQVARRMPVTVTHPEMRRYFMTVSEAVNLVLQAAALAKGGEIFVLDMGEPVKILDLAEELIRDAGYKPYVEIPIHFTGVRMGEKLFEELDVSENNVLKTGCARIYVCKNAAHGDAQTLGKFVEDLVSCDKNESAIREELKSLKSL